MLSHIIHLTRLNKPIGILLLLWPTLTALWLASGGVPSVKLLFIFTLGTVLMRSAGCIVNDLADRHFDGSVERTKTRPLVQQTVSVQAALILVGLLSAAAFTLVLFCNALTIYLAIAGASWTILYPFTKRWMALPQAILGIAFAWGIPMAFAAVNQQVPRAAWFLFGTYLLWPLIYDTQYAMVDREDDKRIGIQSSAILFGQYDRWWIAGLQGLFLGLSVAVGRLFHLPRIYTAALILCTLLFFYQQWLIKDRDRKQCFKAFLNNQWVGLILFLGVALA